jgi:surface antigen
MAKFRSMIAVVLLAAFAVPSGAAPKNKVQEKGNGSGKGTKVKVQYAGGGPPPWAPAHGYRRGGPQQNAETGYKAPFRVDVGRCNRRELGAVLGGVAGGVLGSRVGDGSGRTAAIIAGTVLGSIVGERIGRWMDQVDQACVGQTLEHAPTGNSVEWVNPDTGVVYDVTPTETYRAGDDRYCREYQADAQVGGRAERVYGTACRQPDGSWELVSSR